MDFTHYTILQSNKNIIYPGPLFPNSFNELEKLPLIVLRQMGAKLDVPRAARLKREQLVMSIRQAEAQREGLEVRGGILQIRS